MLDPSIHASGGPAVNLVLDGEEVGGIVVSTAHRLLVMSFPSGSARQVAVGDQVDLKFESGQGERATVAGQVSFWRQAEDADQVRVEIEAGDVVLVEAAFRRQRPMRISVRGKRALRVELGCMSASGTAVETALLNISEKGLGLIVKSDDDRTLAAGQKDTSPKGAWLVRTKVLLPGNDVELQLACRVRYRTLARSCIKYGLEIDAEQTQAIFPGELERVSEHIIRYQQELLENNAA